MSDDITIRNATALLEECLENGDIGPATLYEWFISERELIQNATIDLNGMEKGCSLEVHGIKKLGGYTICPDCSENLTPNP